MVGKLNVRLVMAKALILVKNVKAEEELIVLNVKAAQAAAMMKMVTCANIAAETATLIVDTALRATMTASDVMAKEV